MGTVVGVWCGWAGPDVACRKKAGGREDVLGPTVLGAEGHSMESEIKQSWLGESCIQCRKFYVLLSYLQVQVYTRPDG